MTLDHLKSLREILFPEGLDAVCETRDRAIRNKCREIFIKELDVKLLGEKIKIQIEFDGNKL